MKCPKCQFENAEGIKFCGECGNKLDVPAETFPKDLSFDEKIAKIQKYLPKGLTEKILSQKDRIEGERKQVTVMFCDMAGFTRLVDTLGPEAVYSVMDQVYEILIHLVHDFEGTVNEMTGDGIMALFGAPIALEDAPHRALRSALSIHSEIEKFNEQKKVIVPIKMRIGVHTGPVIVGTLGSDLRVEFKAVGDTVNLASRMEGLAEPGCTYATEDTFKLTNELFRFESLGKKAVKGKRSAVPVYKLLSAKESIHRPRLGLERSIYSEMLGRDKELNKLELQVLKAINGEGSMVNIIGEAGIGKSRLVAELKDYDVIKKVSLFEGRAISTGRNLSFHPVINLLKHWAEIGENDSEATALNKLETSVRKVCPEEVHEVLPFVATLMGMKLSGRYAERVKGIEGEALEKLILKNMRDLLIKATEQGPVIIVIEDLHWADTSSIELMESLFRLAETQKIVFINVFRPAHKETGERLVGTIRERYSTFYEEIVLQPLDKRMSEALINNMLHIKGLQHSVIEQIVERADGNPFFIEEVVRSFIDHGAVVARDGVFEVTEKIDEMVIPHTINDVLMARIDRLEEKTRDLVKIASVIGRSFFYRVLKEMTWTIEDIDNRLSYLKEIELFLERKRMEEIEYLFKHALAQEAAYESILQQMRKELHLKAADSIEKVFKERLHGFYGMLAYHFSKGEDLDKAEEYMIKAGEEALESSASHEALRYYQEALDLYLNKYGKAADPEKLAMLEKNIALAFFYKAEYPDALVYFDRVLERWGIRPLQNKILIPFKLIFDILKVILNLYLPSKKPGKTPTHRDTEIFSLNNNKWQALIFSNQMKMFAEQMAEIKRLLKFDFRKIENWYNTLFGGSNSFSLPGISFTLSNKILDFAEGFVDKKNPIELFCLKQTRTVHNFLSGKWDDIEAPDEILIEESLKVGRYGEVCVYLFFYGLTVIYQGEFFCINSIIEKLSKTADDYDNKLAKQFQLYLEIFLSLQKGSFNKARKSIEQWELLFKVEPDINAIAFWSWKAEFQLLLKDYSGTEKSLEQVGWICRKLSMVPPTIKSLYLYPIACLDIIFLEESINSSNKKSITKYRKKAGKSGKNLLQNSRKSPRVRTRALRLMGQYHWLIDKQKNAAKFWGKSISEGKLLGARPDLARTYMEIGKRLMEEKSKYKELNGIKAAEFLEKARTIFQELDLQWELDELDKITLTG